jgi:phosphoglycerate dehydrogenase-like enzyme
MRPTLIAGLFPLLLCVLCACNSTGADGALIDPNAPAALGSLRHARVATPDLAKGERLVYFGSSLSDEHVARLEQDAPNLELVLGLSREEALARANEAHGVDSFYATPEFAAAAPNLAWVQIKSAGVDRYIDTEHLGHNEALALTNLRAVSGPIIADHVFALLLAMTRDLPVHLANRATGTWDRAGSGVFEPVGLAGRTLLVVGLGGIGSEVAKRAKGFGMTVLATRRSEAERPDYVDEQGTADRLDAFLPRADVVVLCVPLTDETTGLMNGERFALLPDGAYLVNIARGKVVDTDALMAALDGGRLAGAGLDVTDPEPLPADHPLWSYPNVIVTPHTAGRGELTLTRLEIMYSENLRRFAAGEPLYNVIDRDAGY